MCKRLAEADAVVRAVCVDRGLSDLKAIHPCNVDVCGATGAVLAQRRLFVPLFVDCPVEFPRAEARGDLNSLADVVTQPLQTLDELRVDACDVRRHTARRSELAHREAHR